MKLNRFAFLIPVVFLVFSCGKKEGPCELDPEILDQDLEVTITRLEDEFFAAKTSQDFLFLLEKYPDFAQTYFQSTDYLSPDSLAANSATPKVTAVNEPKSKPSFSTERAKSLFNL